MYTHSIVTEWIRYDSKQINFFSIILNFIVHHRSNQFYHGDRNSKLHPMHMVVSSAVAATAESIFLATPLQLLKLRHMNTPVYVAFRTILYECLFEKPPTVVLYIHGGGGGGGGDAFCRFLTCSFVSLSSITAFG